MFKQGHFAPSRSADHQLIFLSTNYVPTHIIVFGLSKIKWFSEQESYFEQSHYPNAVPIMVNYDENVSK